MTRARRGVGDQEPCIRARRAIAVGASIAWIPLVGACGDPVPDGVVESLGGEQAGVEAGPLHRPGQPCLACHDGHRATTLYTVAGTVYLYADTDVPAPAVNVELVDSKKQAFSATTNCAGNFFVTAAEFTPAFPIWATVAYAGALAGDAGALPGGGSSRIEMQSRIGRDGSCATCHANAATQSATDRVHLYTTPIDETDAPRCP